MRNLKRNAAITGAAAILAALGIGGAVTAQALTNDPASIVQQSEGDGEVDGRLVYGQVVDRYAKLRCWSRCAMLDPIVSV